MLLDPHMVDAFAEVHRDRRARAGLPQMRGGLLQRQQFRQRRIPRRIRGWPQHVLGALVAFLQAAHVVPQRLGPARIFEHPRFGSHCEVPIDQGSAAQAAAHKHVHLRVHIEVVESHPRSGVPAGKLGLHFSQRLSLRIGILAVLKLAAPFQDTDLLSGARQPRRGYSAPVTGADDDDRIVTFDLT